MYGLGQSSGLSSLGVPGVPWHTADQLTLFQPGGTDYAHLITTGTPRFSDLLTALLNNTKFIYSEKATKCCEISTADLTVTTYRAVGRSENLGVPVVIRWA